LIIEAEPTVAEEVVKVSHASHASHASDASDIHIAEALSGFGAGWDTARAPAAASDPAPPTADSGHLPAAYDSPAEQVAAMQSSPAESAPDVAAPAEPVADRTVVSGLGAPTQDSGPAPQVQEADEAAEIWRPNTPAEEEVFFGKRAGRRRGGS